MVSLWWSRAIRFSSAQATFVSRRNRAIGDRYSRLDYSTEEPLSTRHGNLQDGANESGCGTTTTSRLSMPAKSSGLHVYTGKPVATAVAAIMAS
jgi:hypothetical protein